MRWIEEHGEEALLPGVNYTQTQLFFLNFAQVRFFLLLTILAGQVYIIYYAVVGL